MQNLGIYVHIIDIPNFPQKMKNDQDKESDNKIPTVPLGSFSSFQMRRPRTNSNRQLGFLPPNNSSIDDFSTHEYVTGTCNKK